jgi:hypothetical protein
MDGIAEPTEEKVAAFMNHQVRVVDDQKAGRVRGGVEKEKKVEHKPADAKRAKDRLHLREVVAK